MMEYLASILLVAMSLVVLCCAFRYAIPAMVQYWCLYNLHDLRDDLFMLGERESRLRHTLLFRDMDALLAGAIHTIRHGDRYEAVSFFLAMADGDGGKVPQEQSWRIRQIEAELKTDFRCVREQDLELISSIPKAILDSLMFRVVSSLPLLQVLFVFASLKRLILMPFKSREVQKEAGGATKSDNSDTSSVGLRPSKIYSKEVPATMFNLQKPQNPPRGVFDKTQMTLLAAQKAVSHSSHAANAA